MRSPSILQAIVRNLPKMRQAESGQRKIPNILTMLGQYPLVARRKMAISAQSTSTAMKKRASTTPRTPHPIMARMDAPVTNSRMGLLLEHTCHFPRTVLAELYFLVTERPRRCYEIPNSHPKTHVGVMGRRVLLSYLRPRPSGIPCASIQPSNFQRKNPST